MEPPIKKTKVENQISQTIDIYINSLKQCSNLKAVLSDEFEKPLPLIKVYVGHAKDTKELSRVISILNEKIPLKDLNHLKRVRKKEVILCPSHYLNGMSSIQEYLEVKVPELKHIFEYFKEIDVPMIAPKVKKHLIGVSWSCNFHPNKYNERLISDSFFSTKEMESHITYMKVVLEVTRWHLKSKENPDFLLQTNATVVVDPGVDSVVAVAFCNNDHPIQHSAMLAIDNVAKTQNGGAWGETCQDTMDCSVKGIDAELLQYLKEIFPETTFRARTYQRKGNDNNEKGSDKGPYLCTNYYVYMLKEPCVMCSMALVHARAKRIFFCFDNVYAGGLRCRAKLQTISSLNHHFEVFTGFLW